MNNKDVFMKLFPRAKEGIFTALQKLPLYDIDTKERVAMFLAQCGHESCGFSVLSENLNYSSKALRAVFCKYFKTQEEADKFARQPEKIANRVYANRMGNGPESSGDGWKYRGRGILQVTGKSNYQEFAKDFDKLEVIDNPDLLSTPEYAVLSAIWFWIKNDLNKYSDAHDVKGATKRINGGFNGLEERNAIYQKIMAIKE